MDGFALWKALACFGEEQTNKVLLDPQWRRIYPEVFERLDSEVKRTKYDTLIPLPILRVIAASEPHLLAFGFREAELICRADTDKIPSGFTMISPLEALDRFGGNLLLEAVDYGTSKV